MPANVFEVKDKVQRFLTDLFGTVQIDQQGRFTFQAGSARVFVEVKPWADDKTVVQVLAPTNMGLPLTPELYRHVATSAGNFVFGHISLIEQEDKTGMILMRHTLLGDYLDPEELKAAVLGVASSSNDMDDKIKEEFGGRVFHEEE